MVEQNNVQHIALKLQWLNLVTVKACQTLINQASEPLCVMGGNMVNLETHLESSGEKKLKDTKNNLKHSVNVNLNQSTIYIIETLSLTQTDIFFLYCLIKSVCSNITTTFFLIPSINQNFYTKLKKSGKKERKKRGGQR